MPNAIVVASTFVVGYLAGTLLSPHERAFLHSLWSTKGVVFAKYAQVSHSELLERGAVHIIGALHSLYTRIGLDQYVTLESEYDLIAAKLVILLLILLLLLNTLTAVVTGLSWWNGEVPEITAQATELNEKILAKCPGFGHTYHPTIYLRSGHLQTIVISQTKETDPPIVRYRREFHKMADGGLVTVDWLHPFEKKEVRDVPTIIILHGLTGGSGELGIRRIASMAFRQGWQVAVMNARGCADSPLTTPKTYCAAWTSDIREVVLKIRQTVQTSPFVGIGFSLGANILVKYVGEDEAQCPLTAAVSVGNPYDLQRCDHVMQKQFPQNVTYNKVLASNLVAYLRKIKKWEAFNGHSKIDMELAMSSSTIREFDDRFTRLVFGYPTVYSFYHDASCARFVSRVKIPLLCLHARDDPICVDDAIPRDEIRANPLAILCTTKIGGHLAWLTGFSRWYNWGDFRIIEYLDSIRNLHAEGAVPTRPGALSEKKKHTEKASQEQTPNKSGEAEEQEQALTEDSSSSKKKKQINQPTPYNLRRRSNPPNEAGVAEIMS